MEKHPVSEYQAKENIGAKRQYSSLEHSTKKPNKKHFTKLATTTEGATETTTTEAIQNKRIPVGAILGISETMQQLNKGLMEKKKEEAIELTTEKSISITEFVFETEEPVTTNPDTPEEDSENPIEGGEGREEESFEHKELQEEKNAGEMQNGHARPVFSQTERTIPTANSNTPSIGIFPPNRDYSDEPWKPIIPAYRDTVRIRNPYRENYAEKVYHHRYEPIDDSMIDDGGPITFSKDSFDKNLRITPEYAGNANNFMIKTNQNLSVLTEIEIRDSIPGRQTNASETKAEIVADDVVILPTVYVTNISREDHTPLPTFNFNEERNGNNPTMENREPFESLEHPVGLEQMISSISLIESDLKSAPENSATTVKPKAPATPKAATIRAVLKVAESNDEEQPIGVREKIEESSTTTTKPLSTTLKTLIETSGALTKPATEITESSENEKNASVINPFLDDSRSSSSNFNFGLPDFMVLKQFHHLDSLLKSFSKPSDVQETNAPKLYPGNESGNMTSITRFPARTKQTTTKSYKKDDVVFIEVSTLTPVHTTKHMMTRKPVVIRGDVEVVSGPIKREPVMAVTEIPKLITLLPVRSNVNMMRPLRPRPKSNVNLTFITTDRRNSKMNSEFKANGSSLDLIKTSNQSRPHPQRPQIVQDKNAKRWVYYPSYQSGESSTETNENLRVVSPELKNDRKNVSGNEKLLGFAKNLTTVPLYNTIESLLNLDYRNREANMKNSSFVKFEEKVEKPKQNTSEIVEQIVKIMENIAISTGDSPKTIVKVNQTMVNKTSE